MKCRNIDCSSVMELLFHPYQSCVTAGSFVLQRWLVFKTSSSNWLGFGFVGFFAASTFIRDCSRTYSKIWTLENFIMNSLN